MAISLIKPQRIYGRYELLSTQPPIKELEATDCDMTSRSDGLEYVNFMQSLNNGTLKAHDNKLNRSNKSSLPHLQISTTPTLATKNKNKSKSSLRKSAPGSLQLTEILQRNEENHRKQMKAVEELMLTSKQEERELKRMEGDILKHDQRIKLAMKNYEAEIYHEKREQENQFENAVREKENIKNQYFIQDDKITKEKINRNMNLLQKDKESGNKSINSLNSLEFQYGAIAEAIALKRQEVESLVKDFETKVRQKEEEELRLKKEFGKVALELSIEAQKRRVQEDINKKNNIAIQDQQIMDDKMRMNVLQEKLKLQSDHVHDTDDSKRRLSQDLRNVKGTLAMQEREEGRRLKDVKSRLYNNAMNQKEARHQSELLLMERQGKQSEEKILAVNTRRQTIQNLITEQRKQKNDLSMEESRRRNFIVNQNYKKQNTLDSIQHFQKSVWKNEDKEHQLYNQLRQYESSRRKQELNVQRIRDTLSEMQKQNNELLQETSLLCQKQEKELRQKLLKEEALLGKTAAKREECFASVVKCKRTVREEKHVLHEQKKIHDRLHRIEQKSVAS